MLHVGKLVEYGCIRSNVKCSHNTRHMCWSTRFPSPNFVNNFSIYNKESRSNKGLNSNLLDPIKDLILIF